MLRVMLIANALLLPVTGLAAFVLYLVPFRFVTKVTVENTSEHALRVVPVGAVGPDGRRSVLPVCNDMGWPAWQRKFAVPPHASVSFWYDWDDINFSELVVEADGRVRVLVVDPTPTLRQYHPPERERILVPNPSELPLADPAVSDAARLGAISGAAVRMTVIVAAGAAVLASFLVLLFLDRRAARATTTPPSSSR